MSVKIVLICEKCGKELSGEPGANTEIGRVVDRAADLGWRWPHHGPGAWARQVCPECVEKEVKRLADAVAEKTTIADEGALPPPAGVPCSHSGCLSHVSHPCEGCGRVGGVAVSKGKAVEE